LSQKYGFADGFPNGHIK